MIVHQVLSGAGPFDAITTEARAFRSLFAQWGWGGRDFAARIAPGLDGAVQSLSRLRVERGDLLLLHHSAYLPHLGELLGLPNRKLLLYHNITPAQWIWDHAPIVALQCAAGRAQLGDLVRGVDAFAADSEFNADELRVLGAAPVAVIPLLVRRGRSGEPAPEPPPAAPTVLFVGRLSPHKRQDEIIRVFSLYRSHRAPQARLVLVGDAISTAYMELLRELAGELAPGAVTIESGLSEAELDERFRTADVFLCLSAHEGFCIPVLEAMRYGLPVVSAPAGAIPEVAGDAALLVDDADPAVVAELLHLAVSDRELRAELIRRGRQRAEVYAPEAVTATLRQVVEQAAALAGPAAVSR